MYKHSITYLLLFAAIVALPAQTPPSDPQTEIRAFNEKLEVATRSMDNAATLALWADDGISLLPSTKPIIGKPAIAAFLDKVTTSIQGAKMEKFEMQCFDIQISSIAADMATEWCTEHQIVQLPGGKPPFDGRGKMLLVLRKTADHQWLLEREMWNQAEAE